MGSELRAMIKEKCPRFHLQLEGNDVASATTLSCGDEVIEVWCVQHNPSKHYDYSEPEAEITNTQPNEDGKVEITFDNTGKVMHIHPDDLVVCSEKMDIF